jgi:RHS repeat-associated protein
MIWEEGADMPNAVNVVSEGNQATFTVTATGTAPLSYQWQKNGVNISLATSAIYTTSATNSGDNGSTFDVVVSNTIGSVTSNTVTLTVSSGPSIATQPSNQTVSEGNQATFTVTATGAAPLSYQWQKNGVNISLATSASYTTPPTTNADNGSIFDVVVTNTIGSVTSSAVTLTVNPSGPTIFYYLDDALATSRVMADSAGNICYDADFYPFGGERPYIISCLQNYKFTGKERDNESSLDNFGARYYSAAIGRFVSPDPSSLSMADLSDPQQLNLYSYVRNNPTSLVDPTGLDCLYFTDDGTAVQSIDNNSNSAECGAHGGDWVNGTVDPDSVRYNSDTDTFSVNSSSAWYNYSTTVSAPGSQTSGVPCSGDCTYQYSQSFNGGLGYLSSLGSQVAGLINARPWVLSWNVPVTGLAGFGFAGDLEWNPKTKSLCVGVGAGLSFGKSVSVGQLSTGTMSDGQSYPNGADELLDGGSLSGGYNSPLLLGAQGMGNAYGRAYGPSAGAPGLSFAATYSKCR